MNLREEINKLKEDGYSQQNAQARICQDIILEEYCFDICFQDDGASLLMNSKEQVLVEKLKSILRHDVATTRFKDVFDICYLSDKVSDKKIKLCISRYIFEDKTLDVNTKEDIVIRMERILTNKLFISHIKTSKKNWLDLSLEEVLKKDLEFVRNLNV